MPVVTLTEARRALSEMIGGYRLITSGVQVAPPSGAYVGVANGGAAARQIVSTDIVLMDVGGTSTPVDTSRWKYGSVYLPDVPLQRLIAEKGYSANKLASEVTDQLPATPEGDARVGMLTLAEPLPAALEPDQTVEMHAIMPPLARDAGRGLHACINRALRGMSMRTVLDITTVDGQYRYDLSAYPWLQVDRQLISVYDSQDDAGLAPPALDRGGELIFDGQIPYLQIDRQPTSTPFSAAFRRPIGTWVRTGTLPAVWADSAVGLVDETDAVFVDPDQLTLCAYYYACDALARAWRNDPAGAWWVQEMARVRPIAARELVLDTTLATIPRRGTGALVGGSGRAPTSWP